MWAIWNPGQSKDNEAECWLRQPNEDVEGESKHNFDVCQTFRLFVFISDLPTKFISLPSLEITFGKQTKFMLFALIFM